MPAALVVGLYAVTLVAALFGSMQGRPHSFAAGTGHENLECVACHHPHAPTAPPVAWQPPDLEVPRLGFYEDTTGDVSSSTLLCMSCHDGVLADEIMLPEPPLIASQIGQSIALTPRGFWYPMGSHPVGVPYRLEDPDLRDAPGAQEGMPVRLPEGRVECVSCHDPHGTAGHANLLVIPNDRSRLCMACHDI